MSLFNAQAIISGLPDDEEIIANKGLSENRENRASGTGPDLCGVEVWRGGLCGTYRLPTLSVAGASRHVRRLPASLRRSLTWDRGLEMAKQKTFTVATNVKVYFCDPHSPRLRGSNENTNRLLRQYLPKRTDLSGYAQSELDKIATRLNQRPRKTLGFETPASRVRASVAPTH